MYPTHLNLRDDQRNALDKLGGNVSEHIRRAVDDYLQKQKDLNLNVSPSLSTRKGDKNGTKFDSDASIK